MKQQEWDDWNELCEGIKKWGGKSGYVWTSEVPDRLRYLLNATFEKQRKKAHLVVHMPGFGWRRRLDCDKRLAELRREVNTDRSTT